MRSHTHCTGNISANFTPHQLCWNEWNGNGYLMQKMQFGGCHVLGRSILKGVSICAAALLILKIVGTRHMQYFLKKKLCKICVLGCVDYYVILGDFRAESMQLMSTGHLHFPFTLRWELKWSSESHVLLCCLVGAHTIPPWCNMLLPSQK